MLMKKDKIRRQVSGHFKKIQLLSESSVKHFRKDEIHVLRVEVKKLRALLRLLNTSSENLPELKISKSLKTFYRRAGDIRNIQNHITWIKNFFSEGKPPSSYIFFLKAKLKEYKNSMDAARISAQRFKSDRSRTLQQVPGEIGFGTVLSFINHKKIEIKKILGGQKTDEVLHALRKELKDIHYNRILIKEYVNLDQLPMIGGTKELLQLLGNHQDYCIHLHYLMSFDVSKSDAAEKKMLQSAKNEALKAKSALREQILQKIAG